jgi:hypothetical protein
MELLEIVFEILGNSTSALMFISLMVIIIGVIALFILL